ncbi:MAG: patatin-like phospholipase family protein [Myxococcota bacterium]|nr:patatin-like phospholipase family protein [Myxococcota bacterium]
MRTRSEKIGLVLSGGGARGAYEVGLLAGLVDVLGLTPEDRPPFQVFTGTSVGAINASFLAANAHRGDLGTKQLVQAWRQLSLEAHLRLDLFGVGRFSRSLRPWKSGPDPTLGRAMFDASGLESFVTEQIDWQRLEANLAHGHLDALVISALRIYDGQRTLFASLSPQGRFEASRDPRRNAVEVSVNAEHVIASAALPFLFPLRRIDGHWYCDGGLRSSTPIAPAIRSGADRLVVVSLAHNEPGPLEPPPRYAPYPGPVLLLGKLLNAMFLDPVNYDLHVLRRLNRIIGVLDDTLTAKSRARFDTVTSEVRGQTYRAIETLVFHPSVDLGALAGVHLRDQGGVHQLGRLGSWFLRRAAKAEASWEVDLASYILFDGGFAERLIEVGRSDAWARADEIRAFFDQR